MTGRPAALATAGALLLLLATAAAAVADPGPPYPDPVLDQAVYDTAGVFEASTIEAVEVTIDEIEARTGAEGPARSSC